jgi:hypothetical protein
MMGDKRKVLAAFLAEGSKNDNKTGKLLRKTIENYQYQLNENQKNKKLYGSFCHI